MGNDASPSMPRPMHWRRGSGVGLLAATAVLSVVLLVGAAGASPGSAITPQVKVKLTRPYVGTPNGVIVSITSGCAAGVSFPVKPVFFVKSGEARESVGAKAKSCGTIDTSSIAQSTAEFESIALSPAATGKHHLKASWTLDFSVDLVATPGGSTPSADAIFEVYATLGLYNLTGGYTIPATYTATLLYSIITGTYSNSYLKQHWTSYLNVSLGAADSYEVDVGLVALVEASVAPGSNSASATLNMGSAKMHASLDSIVLT